MSFSASEARWSRAAVQLVHGTGDPLGLHFPLLRFHCPKVGRDPAAYILGKRVRKGGQDGARGGQPAHSMSAHWVRGSGRVCG